MARGSNPAISTCLAIVYSCFRNTMAELSSCNKDHVACKAENIYFLALYKVTFLIPDLDTQKVLIIVIFLPTYPNLVWRGAVLSKYYQPLGGPH